jgi:hypothetical protein
MAIAHLSITLMGTADLLMHNERLANPFDPITKAIAAITAKKKKQTEEDKLQVQRLEWEGGLYYDPHSGPFLPGANIKKCIQEAATAWRGGRDILRGITPLEAEIPLLYEGPRDLEGLWNQKERFCDLRMVKVNAGKVLRARPRFPKSWGLETSLLLNTAILDVEEFTQYLRHAGSITGLGDYRPTFGRFASHMKILDLIDDTLPAPTPAEEIQP